MSSCCVIVVLSFVEGLRKGTLLMHFGDESMRAISRFQRININ